VTKPTSSPLAGPSVPSFFSNFRMPEVVEGICSTVLPYFAMGAVTYTCYYYPGALLKGIGYGILPFILLPDNIRALLESSCKKIYSIWTNFAFVSSTRAATFGLIAIVATFYAPSLTRTAVTGVGAIATYWGVNGISNYIPVD
jgi:hypothetical protein